MESRKGRRNINYQENKPKGKNKWRLICLISLILMILIYNQVYILYKYTTGQSVTEKQIALYKWMTSIISSEEEIHDSSIEIGVLGNILLSDTLKESYIENQETDFSGIFKYITLANYDFTIASLDMNILESDKINISKELCDELKKLNVDLLNIATKNIGNSNNNEVESTLSSLKKYSISYIGTIASNDDKNYFIINKNDIKIAVLSYVGEEYANNNDVMVYSPKQLENDLEEIRKEKVDGTILFIDTLRSNEPELKNSKKEILKEILDKDIDIVISNDTVVQDIYNKKDKENNKKYIVYSLGDFIGEQREENSDISKLLKISVNKKTEKGESKVEFDVTFEKTFVALSNNERTKYKLVDLEKEINSYREDVEGNVTTAEYYYLLDIKEKINNES